MKISQRKRPWYFLSWVVLSVVALVGSYVLPIAVAPLIVIDKAAPVAPEAIYVPSSNFSDSLTIQQLNAIQAPAAFRAAGSVMLANKNTRAKVSVDEPEILDTLEDGEIMMRISYSYNISGIDLGLQHYPGLALNVEGSCTTEYGWLIQPENGSRFTDYYALWNDSNNIVQVSLADSARPLAYFSNDIKTNTEPGNISFAMIVSSVDRKGFGPGTDPWYLTTPDFPYVVRPGRPAMSCWQNDVWSYEGHNSAISALNTIPGMNIASALHNLLITFLGTPKIVSLGTRLGPSALLSGTTALGETFDATSSSVHDDLERLVLAAYIATVNTLTDSTQFPINRYNISNIALESDGTTKIGVADFVVWSSNVTTLAILPIVFIPTVTLALWLIVLLATRYLSKWFKKSTEGDTETLTERVEGNTEKMAKEAVFVSQIVE